MGDGSGCLVPIHRNPHQLRALAGKGRHLRHRAVNIRRIRIGHGLHDNRRTTTHLNMPNHHRHGEVTLLWGSFNGGGQAG